MHQPPGYVQYGADGEQFVYRLTKALYGLRQDPRSWFDKLKTFLISLKFTSSKSDASLFIRGSLFVLVYVDDIIITGENSTDIDEFVQQLHTMFSLKDMKHCVIFWELKLLRLVVAVFTCVKGSIFWIYLIVVVCWQQKVFQHPW